MTESTVQASGREKRRTSRRWLLHVCLVLVAAVVGVSVGFGVRWLQKRMDEQKSARPEAIVQTANDVQNQIYAGNYDDARDKVDDALSKPGLSAESRQILYMQQAATYQSQENYEAAMESYRKAEAQHVNLQVVQAIAELAVFMDNKQLAVEYYKKAITMIPEDDPMRDESKRYFENWVTTLENGGPTDEGN